MQIRFIVAISLAATTAFAEPSSAVSPEPAHYVDVAVAIGGAQPAGLNVLALVEGGYRIASGPFWIHAEAMAGKGGDDQGSGQVWQGRAGLEARACWTALCGIAGVDLGGHRGTWVQDSGTASETMYALVATPRVACDLGGDHLRMRLGVELGLAVVGRQQNHRASGDTEMGISGGVSGELTFGIGYHW